MCGRLNLLDNEAIRTVFEQFGVSFTPYSSGQGRPTDNLQCIALGKNGQANSFEASWWLIRQADFSPNTRFASFNAKASKLLTLGSTHYQRPRSFPILIPSNGFYEWHNKQPYWINWPTGTALAGVAKAWQYESEWKFSCAVVTLAPHPEFSRIHNKSIPLILPPSMQQQWLQHQPWQQKSMLHSSQLYCDLRAIAVNKALTSEVSGVPNDHFHKDH